MRTCAAAAAGLTAAFAFAALATAEPETKFVSKLYRYSIAVPGGSARWDVQFALVPWSTDSLPGIDSPALDQFRDSRTGRIYLIAARRTPSLQRWTAFVVRARPSVCFAPRSLGASTLAGARARVVTWRCADGYWSVVITAVHGGRGYFVLLASPSRLSHAADLRVFDDVRRGFRFLG